MSLKLSKIVCYLFKYEIPNRIPILWSPLAWFIFVPSWGYDSPLTRVQSSHHDSTKLRSRKKFSEVRWVNAELRSYLHYVVASEIQNLLEASIVEFFCTMYGKRWQTYALQNALSCPLHNSIINREGKAGYRWALSLYSVENESRIWRCSVRRNLYMERVEIFATKLHKLFRNFATNQ